MTRRVLGLLGVLAMTAGAPESASAQEPGSPDAGTPPPPEGGQLGEPRPAELPPPNASPPSSAPPSGSQPPQSPANRSQQPYQQQPYPQQPYPQQPYQQQPYPQQPYQQQPYQPPPGQPYYPPEYAPQQPYPPPTQPAQYPPSAYPTDYPQASYPPPQVPERRRRSTAGRHRHDGFMARFTLGAAYGRVAQDDQRPHLSLSGGGVTTAIAVGFAVVESFSLHAEIFGMGGGNASMEIDGVAVDEGESTFNISGLGAGATFHIMPINMYISATVGIGGVTVDTSRTPEMISDTGLVLHALLGKEFWLSANWGLGAALQFMFATAPDETADDVTWTGFGLGVLISATYQ